MIDFGGGDEIRFERIGKAGVVTLTRPKALNAVTHRMVTALSAALHAWTADDAVATVILRGEGRAFSAGGDVLEVYNARGSGSPPLDFFADEYRLNAQLARFEKPYVSLIHGIVMGGGVGISFHGSHRVMTETALFAMPEVGIGFFPDVGGSFLLSRLKGSYGIFLGLTGKRVKCGDALRAGLATHVVRNADLEALTEEICRTGLPDRSLRPFLLRPQGEEDEGDLHTIAKLFSRDDLSDLVTGLRQAAGQGDAVAGQALEAMGKASPTSLAVAFRQLNMGAMLEMDECMRMEFRIVTRMLAGHEFYEGIRAVVIDKDQRPNWLPARLEDVSQDTVDAYFLPPPGGDLVL